MKILFATNNIHKVDEIRSILPGHIELLSPADLNIGGEIPENGDTLEENAAMKAEYLYGLCSIPTFADDTGLEIESLGGAPGVMSARFAGEDKDSSHNIDKVLRLLAGSDNRKARFRTVIALVGAGETMLFEGQVKGVIINERRGAGGFGYDPVFQPDGFSLTFAEMPLHEKNRVSHRAVAFRKLARYLENKG